MDAPTLQQKLLLLLDQLTEEPARPCQSCGRKLWFIRHPKTDKVMPITDEATNHFSDCPEAERFRRRKALERNTQPTLFATNKEGF